jgi:peptidyl-prolyl cis-trans isomerase SurA
MKKLVVAFFVLISISSSAQTLFYYGNDSVSSKEFLRAWHKNNTGVKTEKAFRDYLDLYIASRLKIKRGHGEGIRYASADCVRPR